MDIQVDPIANPTNYNTAAQQFVANPMMVILLCVILVVFLSIFSNFGGNDEGNAIRTGSKLLEIIIWSFGIFLLLAVGLKNLFGIEIITSIKKIFTPEPEIDITVVQTIPDDPEPPPPENIPEVFNIPDNRYTFDNAKAICKAYGGRLANYDDIETAYSKGAEWCNFGWSAGQMALYPTQKTTYNNLQDIDGHEHDCGRQGINGGYIANPNVKFGVNCFAYKPAITPDEQATLNEGEIYPKTKADMAFQQRVDYWKKHISDLILSPFNYDTWSKV